MVKHKDGTSQEKNTKITPPNKSNPITPRKTANRLYGGYNQSQKIPGYQNIDSLSLLADFCFKANECKTVDDLMSILHSTTIGTLGYFFIAVGLINNRSSYLNIKLLDRTGNIYSSKLQLSQVENPIVNAFINKSKQNININTQLNNGKLGAIIPLVSQEEYVNAYLNNSPGIVIPLISQDESYGVLVAGSSSPNQQNDEILTILANYLTMFIINKQLSEKVSQDVNIDFLTGLNNHRDFQEKLSEEIKNAETNNQSISIIIFDINNISQINREHGHARGDEIIKIISEKVKQNIRPTDIAGRYGGDEIAVILPNTDNAKACYIAEYINHGISCCPIDDIGGVKVSIGVSTYPDCSKDQEKLLIITEQAMFISKNKGYQNGLSTVVSAQDIDFWNEMALDSLATVIAKKHSQWGINFEEELVSKFHSESLSSSNHLIDVVTSLAGAIDAKDPYTKGHSTSVSRYAEALARAINLPESEVERIKLGAILHDVGKIGIPEDILRKPGMLTDEEWEIMKQHPKIGAEKVLKPIASLADLIPMVVHHHENWNGKGYPDGLKGEEIPLGARIVSIADAFHSMVSDRPYRKGLSLEKSIEILKVGAGIQWDKDLVRKFIILAPSLHTKT